MEKDSVFRSNEDDTITVRGGMMPGTIRDVQLKKCSTLRDFASKMDIELGNVSEWRVNGKSVDDFDVVLTEGTTVFRVANVTGN